MFHQIGVAVDPPFFIRATNPVYPNFVLNFGGIVQSLGGDIELVNRGGSAPGLDATVTLPLEEAHDPA